MKSTLPKAENLSLVGDIRRLIEASRAQLAAAVNSALTLLYWNIGQRIHAEVLQGGRAEYGEQIVPTLVRQLESEYGRGFSEKNLRHMLRFAEACPDGEIVSTLSRQLSWSHFLEVIYLKDGLKRDFYTEMCRLNRLVAIDLKLGDFKAADKGQMELDQAGIHVAEYLTELPPKELLQRKLHDAIVRSRERLGQRNGEQAP